MKLVLPDTAHLPADRAALEAGWSPRPAHPNAWQLELQAIDAAPLAFLRTLDDPLAQGPAIQPPGGTTVKRLPSFRRWIFADGVCGNIELRWQKGTNALPPTCDGHIGYAVVPSRRGEGLATFARSAVLPLPRMRPIPPAPTP